LCLRLLRIASIVPAAARSPPPRTAPTTAYSVALYELEVAAVPQLLAFTAAGDRPAGHVMQAEALRAPTFGW
jgi:hypothetical protein